MNANIGPVFLDDEANTQIRPCFLRDLGTFIAELWQDGRMVAAHGAAEWFDAATTAVDTVNAFLHTHGIRALTVVELAQLHEGLLREKGGAGYALLIRQADRRV